MIKNRLALGKGYYSGLWDCVKRISKEEGKTALLKKGLLPSVTGFVPLAAIDLAIFNSLKDNYI